MQRVAYASVWIKASGENDLTMTISKENLNYDDFEFKETDLSKDNTDGLHAISGEIEITYKPSKIIRKYQTGNGTSWPAEFEFDLKTNFFGTR